jgi:hypothetical protein
MQSISATNSPISAANTTGSAIYPPSAGSRCCATSIRPTDLAHNHGTMVVEDLKVASMSKSAKGTVAQPGTNVRQKAGLNRSIADQGWSEIRRQLMYKTTRHGGQLIAVPAVGTSQTLAQCGTRDPESRQAADSYSPAPRAGIPIKPTEMQHRPFSPKHSAPPGRPDPPRAVTVGHRARAVRKGKAPNTVAACVNQPKPGTAA